jgi:hypothetical protein
MGQKTLICYNLFVAGGPEVKKDSLWEDLKASRSFWLVMAGVAIASLEPVLGAVVATAGLCLMRYDTKKMNR